MPLPNTAPVIAMAEAEERFQAHVRQLNLRAARYTGILVSTLVPGFSVLDFFVLQKFWGSLFIFRLAVGLSGIVMALLTLSKRSADWGKGMTIYLGLATALSVVIMTHLHQFSQAGDPSQYYAGVMLVVIAIGLICVWTTKLAIIVFAIIYAAYLIPSLWLMRSGNLAMYLSNNFFLLASMIIASVGQFFTYNLQRREVYASFGVEATAKKLEEANTALKDLDRYKTQLFANVTHELKTPLTLILAPTEAVLRGELGQFNETQQEYFRRIYQNGLRLMRLISDLLDLAKLEDSKMRLRLEEVELVEMLNGLLGNIRPLAERKGIQLDLKVEGSATTMYGERHRLEQIFVNFLSNAVKFTGEGGAVTVTIDSRGEGIVIGVQDTGIGIPKEKLATIFDRFSQVDGSSTRKHGGTGIGLALARELTMLHGGTVWAESEEGKGACVSARFRRGKDHFADQVIERRSKQQLVEKDRRSEGALPEWWEQLSGKNEFRFLSVDDATERRLAPRERVKAADGEIAPKVLVVEDSREMLQFIQLQLREHFDVYLAENGLRGWEIVQKVKPDLVVTDFMMPEMDGRELTQLIKETEGTSHIPVVMLTAKADEEDRIAGRKAGADQYLAKPFSTPELLQVMRSLLKSQEKAADKLLSQRMDSLQVVAARMAHEIHNPLNYIRNGALLAKRSLDKLVEQLDTTDASTPEGLEKRGKLVGKINHMVEQITLGTDRISKSVDLLREYSREGYKAVRVDYDVDEALQKVIQVVAPKDSSRRNLHYTPSSLGKVLCVPQEFHEVISNLVQNAIDATPDGGNVWLTAERKDEEGIIRMLVRDDGAGIPEENLSRIFSPMFTTKAPGQGMGMGLSITYRLLQKMGGKVRVQSTVGEGTTFEVLWPIVPKDEEASAESPKP